MFAARCMMQKTPIRFNALIMFLCLSILGQALRICEAPLSRITSEMNHLDYFNCVWEVLLAMTTSRFKIANI